MNVLRGDIIKVKHSQVLMDPFPEHTAAQMNRRYFKMFGVMIPFGASGPEPISIWKAYRLGYDRAYQEITEGLSHLVVWR